MHSSKLFNRIAIAVLAFVVLTILSVASFFNTVFILPLSNLTLIFLALQLSLIGFIAYSAFLASK